MEGFRMREVVFALEFRGRATGLEGSDRLRRARLVAGSQAMTVIIGAAGVRAAVEAVEGQEAVLESRVERFGDGTFVEDGTITYGTAGSVRFETLGRGSVGPAPRAGWVVGGVVWTITGGDGVCAAARGLITSNFTVSADGDVVDNHVARLYLP
jgi:hypothetical protein